ncbi:HutD/Ves family protein [Chondromyces apiculatus]|uniref:Putative histidine degradation protein n=1 Tax=Chondromyces apiculatus DSM 436 TaxID=1192034 RepID=A0A017TEP3_9BACT|nr:HutD family protein [Chondromyces apiculatus]EYF07300.1 putative histidine degradation protein [Chondromyces apiculatus DSM 436]
MKLTSLPQAAYRRMRWKNGLGWTTELAVHPAGGAPFDWRVSIAEVDSDCDFSPFPDHDRTLLVLDGEGMELHFDQAAPSLLRGRGSAATFSGDWSARCRLLGGPTRDFNVITRRAVYTHEAAFHREGDAVALLPAHGDLWLIHALGGALQLDGAQAIAPGDSLLLEADAGEARPVSVHGGDLVLVRVSRTER